MAQTHAGFAEPDVPEQSIYDRCVRCGFCLPACPTYLETMTETSGPRGRISLIKAVAEGQLDLRSPGFVHQMNECLDCRACETACPSGVLYGRLVENARAQIERAVDAERTPAQRRWRHLLLRTLFFRPAWLRSLARLIRFAQRLRLDVAAHALGITRRLGIDAAAENAPRIPGRFFIARNQRIDAPNPRETVMFHSGCVAGILAPEMHDATLRMLQRSGAAVVVPARQGCCGAIAAHAGDAEAAREFARNAIADFERSGADLLITNVAGCGGQLKSFDTLLDRDDAWRERAQHFVERVRDVTQYLAVHGFVAEPKIVEGTVTYQEPCHLTHGQRISAQPKALLRTIPGLRLVDHVESTICCGAAGIYGLTQPEMSARLRKRKVDHLLESGADVIATCNVGCAMQLRAELRARGTGVRVAHVVELLDEACQG